MSNIQIRRSANVITTVSITILDVIAIAVLLQLHQIPPLLAFPLFLIPIAIYTSITGFKSRKEPHRTDDSGYHFTWAGIMLAVGTGWIVLYEGMGVIIGAISILSIVLGFVYLNKIKSVFRS